LTARASEYRRGNWLRLLCSGDHEAFAEFVDEYQQLVFLCCRTLGLNESDAEDVASETFLAAYQRLSGFRGQSKLSTWLWQIAYYKGINYLRKDRRYREPKERIDKQLTDRSIAEVAAELESAEEAESIWRAVRQLPKEWAMAIVLFYREDRTITEISKIMKKRRNTVKTYLFRGRNKLKTILGSQIGEKVYANR
jgi:RNA polymerase sigma factor (sigma-70 family)